MRCVLKDKKGSCGEKAAFYLKFENVDVPVCVVCAYGLISEKSSEYLPSDFKWIPGVKVEIDGQEFGDDDDSA